MARLVLLLIISLVFQTPGADGATPVSPWGQEPAGDGDAARGVPPYGTWMQAPPKPARPAQAVPGEAGALPQDLDPAQRARAERNAEALADPTEAAAGFERKGATPPTPAIEPDPERLWLDRGFRLPRLGQNLSEGRLAQRSLDATYRIQAGDQLRVVTWGGTALNEVVPVDASGSVALPGFGAVPVAGRSLAEAQTALTDLARSHFRQAGVLVGVEQAGAVAVTVVGDVADPGSHSLPAGATILDALSAALGVLPSGTLRDLQVRAPGAEPITVDLYRLAVDGQADQLRPLVPGTLVFVGVRGPEVQVFGAVQRQAAVELRRDETLAEAIRLAGGLRGDADTQVIRVLREGEGGQDLRQLSLADLDGVVVAPGDRILVSARAALGQRREAIRVSGQVRSPGVYAWSDGLTVAAALAAAGGILPDAELPKALIRRQRAEAQALTVAEGISVPTLHELVGPVSGATIMEPLDELIIPVHPPLVEKGLRINVRGAVMHEGAQPFTPGMTVQQAILLSGGLSADAQIDAADLVRVNIDASGDRSVERIRIDLRRILLGETGPILKPLDEIVVRQRNDRRIGVTLRGAVRNSGEFVLAQGATLGQVMALAGGLSDQAFVEGIRLFRQSEVAAAAEYIERLKQQLEAAVAVNQRALVGGGSGAEEDFKALQVTIAQQEAEIAKLAKARATGRLLGLDFRGLLIEARSESDVVLQDGDLIEVPIRPGTLRVFGEVMNPGSLRHEDGLRVQTLIARSGGYTQQADQKRVFVVRADGAVVATAAGKGSAWDGVKRGWITTTLKTIELKEGDTVIVPPDLEFKASKLVVAKDLTTILFQIAVAAATVVAVAG